MLGGVRFLAFALATLLFSVIFLVPTAFASSTTPDGRLIPKEEFKALVGFNVIHVYAQEGDLINVNIRPSNEMTPYGGYRYQITKRGETIADYQYQKRMGQQTFKLFDPDGGLLKSGIEGNFFVGDSALEARWRNETENPINISGTAGDKKKKDWDWLLNRHYKNHKEAVLKSLSGNPFGEPIAAPKTGVYTIVLEDPNGDTEDALKGSKATYISEANSQARMGGNKNVGVWITRGGQDYYDTAYMYRPYLEQPGGLKNVIDLTHYVVTDNGAIYKIDYPGYNGINSIITYSSVGLVKKGTKEIFRNSVTSDDILNDPKLYSKIKAVPFADANYYPAFLEKPSQEVLGEFGLASFVEPKIDDIKYDYEAQKITGTTSNFEGEVTFEINGTRVVNGQEVTLEPLTEEILAYKNSPKVEIPVVFSDDVDQMSYDEETQTVTAPTNTLFEVNASVNRVPEIHIVNHDLEILGTKAGGGLKVERIDDPSDENGTKIKFNDSNIKELVEAGFKFADTPLSVTDPTADPNFYKPLTSAQRTQLAKVMDTSGLYASAPVTLDTKTEKGRWWNQFDGKRKDTSGRQKFGPTLNSQSMGDGSSIHSWTFSEQKVEKPFKFGKPVLTLEKVGDPANVTTPGQTVNYTITVKNDGALVMNDVKITDEMLGVKDLVVSESLAPGESVSKTFEHVVTQDELDAGYFTNTASTTGVPVNPDPNSDVKIPFDPTDGSSTVKTPGKLVFEKLADTDVIYEVGQKVTYRFKFSNTGATSIYDIKLTDDKLGIADEVVVPELKPREVRIYEKEYTVQEGDIVEDKVTNVASSYGEIPGPTPNSPRIPTSPQEKTVTIPYVPGDKPTPEKLRTGLELEKTAIASDLAKETYITSEDVGKKITYQFLFTNTGNTVLKNVKLTDEMLGLDKVVFAQILPGESLLHEETYTIQEADLKKPSVANTATGTGDPQPDPKQPETPVPPLDNPPESSTDIPVGDPTVPAPAPGLTLKKAADASALTYPGFITAYDEGKTITYTFTFENTGNVEIKNVTLTDEMLGLDNKVVIESLPAGETATYTHAYQVVKADFDKKVLHNVATTTGEPQPHPDRPNVPAPDLKKVPPAETDVPVGDPEGPELVTGMTLKKEADTSDLTYEGFISADDAGKTITYRFTFENTGNTVLKNVTLTDEMLGLDNKVVFEELLPGEIKVYEQTYTVLESDIGKELVHNKATASGEPQPDPKQPNKDVPKLTPPTAETDVPVGDPEGPELVTGMSLDKEADTSALTYKDFISALDEGRTITYKFTFENTGNTVLKDVKLTDEMLGIADKVVFNELLPGEKKIYEVTYEVTKADIGKTVLHNEATASGEPQPDPRQPNKEVPPLTPPTDEVDVPVGDPDGPELVTNMSFAKEADTSALTYKDFISALDEGKVITYKFTFENTGNVDIDNVSLTDALLGLDNHVVFEKLKAGESKTYTHTYEVTKEDIGKTVLHNEATASGEPQPDPRQPNKEVPSLTPPTNTVDVPVGDPQGPELITAMTLDKKADVSQLANKQFITSGDVGNKIIYTFTFTNTGNTVLKDIKLTDEMLSIKDKVVLDELLPGEAKEYSAEYVLTQEDVKSGPLTNVALGDATPEPDPRQPHKDVPPLKDKPVAKAEVPVYVPGGGDTGEYVPHDYTPEKHYQGIIPKTSDASNLFAILGLVGAGFVLGVAGLYRLKKN